MDSCFFPLLIWEQGELLQYYILYNIFFWLCCYFVEANKNTEIRPLMLKNRTGVWLAVRGQDV